MTKEISTKAKELCKRSRLLDRILSLGGLVSIIELELKDFRERFDREQAKIKGLIIPQPGFEKDYDRVQKEITGLERQLEAHLDSQRQFFGDPSICYRHMGTTMYQLEISTATLKKTPAPESFVIMSQTKTTNRYYTPIIKNCLKRLDIEKDNLEDIRKELLNRQLAKFDAHYQQWISVVQHLAELDALLSLSLTSSSAAGGPVCRPVFLSQNDCKPFFSVTDLRHPCIVPRVGSDFIPNDIQLGSENDEEIPRVILLTGPNMGGKSTLLRQACIAVIMAQMGCFVTATRCILSPVDRIFTRIGASDDIISGQSTFMVELQETSNILRHATAHSLVILDELGRGTSTYDGYSIAFAVLLHLISTTIGCRVLFSTHYHKLTQEFVSDPRIGLYHMSCFVDDERKDVTFLYKLTRGICPKSYGMNVARMAGIPERIVNRAEEVALQFERTSSFLNDQSCVPMENTRHIFTEIMNYKRSLEMHLCGGHNTELLDREQEQIFGSLLSIWKRQQLHSRAAIVE